MVGTSCLDKLLAFLRRVPAPVRVGLLVVGYVALGVALNVSVQQLEHATSPDFVARVCEDTGLSAGHLTLEVTESAVMKNDQRARAAFTRLKSLGVNLAHRRLRYRTLLVQPLGSLRRGRA